MKLNRFLMPALGGLAALPGSLGAQEALRGAVQTDRALQYRPPASVRPDGMHLGPVQLSVGVSLGLEYNDNIRASQSAGKMDDVILRPQLDVGAVYPITETSALTVGVGVGYDIYLDHSEYNALTLVPDSALSYTVRIQDVALSVYEQVDYSEDVISQPELSGQARYPRLNNTVGLRAVWSPADWQYSVGYSHYNFVSFDDQYAYLDRASEQFMARGGYSFGPRSRAGLEASVSLTTYDQSLRNDFSSYSVGPYVDWAVREDLLLTARGGYVIYAFDNNATGPALDDLSSYYVQLSGSHQITEFISHTLSAVRDVSVGINSDYTERLSLAYNIRWQMMENLDVGAGVNYDLGAEPDTGDPGDPFFRAGEDYDRYGFNLGAGYRWTEHLRSSLSYRYYKRSSDEDNRDYDNNVVSLVVSYRF